MKLKAIDQLHVSSVKADAIRPNEEFEVSDPIGKQLAARGLAKKVAEPKKASKKAAAKAAPVQENKMAAASENKAIVSPPSAPAGDDK